MIIHVDPRFTRTSAAADIYARIRPGTDAAFLNAMINHILVNKLYDEDYVVTHTNALFLGDEAFDFKDGLFSGYDEAHHNYDTKTWGYQLDAKGKPRIARSLDDPHCVFTRLKTFVSRYTLEMGERITGIPAAQIQQIAETMAKNRPGSILYALGHDPAHDRRAGHPLVHDPAAAARQHRQARRRRQRAARRAERAGRLRHGGAQQLHTRATSTRRPMPSRRSTTTCARTASPTAAISSTRSRRSSATPRPPRTISRYAWLPKRDAVQGLRHHADVRGRPRRQAEDALDRRAESRGHVAQPEADVRGDGEARDAGGPGALGDGDGGVLAAARRRSEVDPDRGDPAAGGVLHGEERHHHQLGRHGAVAPRRREAAGAGQARRRDRRPRLPRGARPGQGLDGAEGRDHPEGVLDLHHGRGRPARDQRLRRARQPGDRPQGRRSHSQGQRSPRRRLDVVRRLDLRGRLRQRREPLEAPRLDNRSRRPRPLSGLRLDLAQQHAHPLQPRVVRPGRQAVSGLEAHRLVGRAGEALDGIRRARRPRRDRRTRHAERPAAPST